MQLKTRNHVGYTQRIGGPKVEYISTLEFIETTSSPLVNGRYRTFNYCMHQKCTQPGSVLFQDYEWYNISFMHHVDRNRIFSEARRQAYLELDFQKNNSFELIPFLVDWDSAMSMFSKKFVKDLSYGSVTWGVLPFISDMRSLIATLSDINSGIRASYKKITNKRISRRCPFKATYDDGAFNVSIAGTLAYSGFVTGDISLPDDLFDQALLALDELGVHPDLKTAWDVIPLSFVVDYFIPIGDMLESAHPRGWFRPTFSVSGGYSISATVNLTGNGINHKGNGGTYNFYMRTPGVLDGIGTRPSVDPEFRSPSFRELFNTAYLALSRRK